MYLKREGNQIAFHFSIDEDGFNAAAYSVLGRDLTSDEMEEAAQKYEDDWFDILCEVIESLDFDLEDEGLEEYDNFEE